MAPRKPEGPKRARSEAVIMKPVERVSYAAILKNLKSRVNPEELGVKVGGIRETRTKDLLVEIKCAAADRGKLDSAFRDAVGESGSVLHLVPMVEVEILDVDPTVEEEEVAKAVRSCLREEPSACVKVSLTRKPFKGTRKAFVRLEVASALTLPKATYIKIFHIPGTMRCAAFRDATQIGGLKDAAERESKLAAEKSPEVRRIAPIDKALKFKANAVSGSLSGEETGEF